MFKPVHINGKTIDDTWHQLLINLWKNGRKYKITSGSFSGNHRLEFDFASGMIEFPDSRPLAPRMPEGSNLAPTTTDDKIGEYFANYLMDPTLAPNEEYKYSTWINGQILPYPKYCQEIKCEHIQKTPYTCSCNVSGDVLETNYDLPHMESFKCPLNKPNTQLEWCIEHFKSKGYGNNHCSIMIGNPWSNLAYDRPYSNENERGTSPCLRNLQFKIKDNRFLTMVIYRSWDLFAGWPENIGGFTLLSEYICSQLDGVAVGPLSFACDGLHAYDYQLEVLRSRLGV